MAVCETTVKGLIRLRQPARPGSSQLNDARPFSERGLRASAAGSQVCEAVVLATDVAVPLEALPDTLLAAGASGADGGAGRAGLRKAYQHAFKARLS